jgi:hypothetical protein
MYQPKIHIVYFAYFDEILRISNLDNKGMYKMTGHHKMLKC